MKNYFIHKTAEISPMAKIGKGCKIWNDVQIRERAVIGENNILGKGVYVDFDVIIGSNCKIQNYVCLFHGVKIEDGVFLGPHVCFTNNKTPRAINEKGELTTYADLHEKSTLVKKGASIGANCTIIAGVTVGEYALIGGGSVVTKNIPPYSLAYGNPARVHGKVDKNGNRI